METSITAESLEGNKLIAEFMGYDYKTGITPSGSWQRFFKRGGSFEDSFPYAEYHTSWNALMPVARKAALYVKVDDEGQRLQEAIFQALRLFDIGKLYTAVLQFIVWYKST